jgi:hypothetical protein
MFRGGWEDERAMHIEEFGRCDFSFGREVFTWCMLAYTLLHDMNDVDQKGMLGQCV